MSHVWWPGDKIPRICSLLLLLFGDWGQTQALRFEKQTLHAQDNLIRSVAITCPTSEGINKQKYFWVLSLCIHKAVGVCASVSPTVSFLILLFVIKRHHSRPVLTRCQHPLVNFTYSLAPVLSKSPQAALSCSHN